MRKLIGLGLSALIISFGFPSSAYSVWQEPPGDMKKAGINIVDSWISNGNQTSQIISTESRGRGQMPHERICEGFGADHCNFDQAKYMAAASLILPVCASATDSYCIEGLAQVSGSGQIAFENTGNAGGDTIPADKAHGLPKGGQVSLWSSSQSEARFAIHSVLLMNYDRATRKFRPRDFQLSLVPYQEKAGNFRAPSASERYLSNEKRWQAGASSTVGCVWTSRGFCGVETDFPDGNLEYKVSLRLAKNAGTWFRGRIANPDIEVSSINSSTNRLTLTGGTMETLKAYVSIPKSDVEQEHLDWLCDGRCDTWLPNVINLRADYPNSPGALDAFRKAAGDTSAALEQKWSFGVIPPFNNACLKDTSRVNGFVSSNASVYQAGAPSFDGASLNYKVNSYHFLPDGVSQAQGSYYLVINSETARCLYGFSKAPVKAKVQVVGVDGEQQVITDTLSESKGWIRLSVAGFHYSSEKIKVSLEQDGASVQAKAATLTLARFATSTKVLSLTQKSQLKNFLQQVKSNPKFICTGTYLKPSSKTTALARARAACNYAKSLDKNHSYFAQAKQTSAKSYDAKVMVVSK